MPTHCFFSNVSSATFTCTPQRHILCYNGPLNRIHSFQTEINCQFLESPNHQQNYLAKIIVLATTPIREKKIENCLQRFVLGYTTCAHNFLWLHYDIHSQWSSIPYGYMISYGWNINGKWEKVELNTFLMSCQYPMTMFRNLENHFVYLYIIFMSHILYILFM